MNTPLSQDNNPTSPVPTPPAEPTPQVVDQPKSKQPPSFTGILVIERDGKTLNLVPVSTVRGEPWSYPGLAISDKSEENKASVDLYRQFIGDDALLVEILASANRDFALTWNTKRDTVKFVEAYKTAGRSSSTEPKDMLAYYGAQILKAHKILAKAKADKADPSIVETHKAHLRELNMKFQELSLADI